MGQVGPRAPTVGISPLSVKATWQPEFKKKTKKVNYFLPSFPSALQNPDKTNYFLSAAADLETWNGKLQPRCSWPRSHQTLLPGPFPSALWIHHHQSPGLISWKFWFYSGWLGLNSAVGLDRAIPYCADTTLGWSAAAQYCRQWQKMRSFGTQATQKRRGSPGLWPRVFYS